MGLTDQQQIALGNQQYMKTIREDRARIVSSGPWYELVQRVARRIEGPAETSRPSCGR
jgi:hypothetical protein